MTIPSSGPVTFTDIQTEFGGTNPIALNEYYAGGGLVPAGTSGTYGAVPSSGALSVQNFYGTSNFVPIYIEDVFSTWLYTGNSPSTQSIVNGIDLATYGGMVWCKSRNYTYNHCVMDTARGNSAGNIIFTNSALAQQSAPNAGISSYNSNGFSLRYDDGWGTNEPSGSNIVSWTFRKQPKFFDVVTYTGNGSAPRDISHNLGSVPGCIMIKRTDSTGTWTVYHSGIGNTKALFLNATAAADTNSAYWNNTTPTSSVFTLGGTFGDINANGATYVAYLFAHDAGGFGLTGSDNVITCGSFTSDIAGVGINLGYEPQWVMVKVTNGVGLGWYIWDNMRGFVDSTTGGRTLQANSSDAEANTNWISPTATGFKLNAGQIGTGNPFIYIAIRRGPMKVPTVGTSVFTPLTTTSGSVRGTTNFPIDMQIFGVSASSNSTMNWSVYDRIRSLSTTTTTDQYGRQLLTTSSTSENSAASDGYNTQYNNTGYFNQTGSTWSLNFVRANNFLDTICYNGNSTYGATQTHRLGITPEMMWFKCRSTGSTDWIVWHKAFSISDYLRLTGSGGLQTGGASGTEYFNNTLPTSSVITLGAGTNINLTGRTYVGYMFGTVAGVSKVGSYTGTGAAQTINCGFTTGARFVMIRRAVAGFSGDWYVFDTARGFTSGNDPWILFNQTQAQTTGTNYVDPQSTGFTINASAPNEINASGNLFIFWAIA